MKGTRSHSVVNLTGLSTRSVGLRQGLTAYVWPLQARRQEDERMRELARAGPLHSSADPADTTPVVAQVYGPTSAHALHIVSAVCLYVCWSSVVAITCPEQPH